MKKQLINGSMVAGLIFSSDVLLAEPEQALWLPKTYRVYMPQLQAAAKQAEAGPRCQQLLSGGLGSEKPGQDTVEFRLTCRDINRRSYNLRYSYTPSSGQIQLTHEQKSRQLVKQEREIDENKARIFAMAEAIAKESAALDLEKDDSEGTDAFMAAAMAADEPVAEDIAWQACIETVYTQARGMRDLKIHDDPRPVSKVVHNVERDFVIDFDAKNPQFRNLYYRAYCHVWQDGSSAVKIKARRNKD